MSLPVRLRDWVAGRFDSVRCAFKCHGRPLIVFASRGPRYVLIRVQHRDRPWLCVRATGSSDSWDKGTYAEREDFVLDQIRKLSRPAQGAVDRPCANDQEIARKFPHLHQHLTLTSYEDGSPRQTCSLTFFAQQGRFRGFLNDRDSGGAIGVEADGLQGILRALEAELASPQPSWFWRNDQGPRAGVKGKKNS